MDIAVQEREDEVLSFAVKSREPTPMGSRADHRTGTTILHIRHDPCR